MPAPTYNLWDSETHEWIETMEARLDPLETEKTGENVYLKPADCTEDPLPDYGTNEIPIRNTILEKWEVQPDFRNATVRNIWGKTVEITEIGPLPEDCFCTDGLTAFEEKVIVLEKELKIHATELRSGRITVDNIPFFCNNDGIVDLIKAERWLENELIKNKIHGTVTTMTWDGTIATLNGGELVQPVAVTNVIVLDDANKTSLIVKSITNNAGVMEYTFEDVPAEVIVGENTILQINGEKVVNWQVINPDGTFYPTSISKAGFTGIELCMIDYVQATFYAQYLKRIDLMNRTEADIDDFVVDVGWPATAYTLDPETNLPTSLQYIDL